MTSKEALKTLYEERAYAYNEKVNHKGDGWKEAIEHYDKIGKCLSTIEKDLEVLEILKKRPDLLCCFAHDGVFTWDDYNDTYSDEDKQYIGATKEEFEKVKEWLKNEYFC